MQTIILATDFSEAALCAGRYTAALTRQIPVSRIVLYHSYYAMISTDTPLIDTEYYSVLQKESISRLNELKRKLAPLTARGVRIECLAGMFSLRDAIRTDLLKENPSLIVMGITGKTQTKEKIMGSQAVMAARHTSVPLLLIPFDATFKEIQKVVFAWDMKYSAKIFPEKLFKDILHILKAELIVFNVDYKNKSFDAEIIDEQKFMHRVLEKENASFFYSDHPDAAEGIIGFAERQQADAVIVIPRRNTFPENLFRKKVTKRLAFRIKIPLLILPGDSPEKD